MGWVALGLGFADEVELVPPDLSYEKLKRGHIV
ncbi:MAG: hypothetical protein ACI9JZ_003071, partial [Lentimonas sp.]